jgi:ABC-type nickel/cobalt efflux system permease component RcnA
MILTRIHTYYASRRLLATLLLSLYLILAWPLHSWAHPLGNFTVNRYSRVELGAQQATLLYIIDMAEIPTQQEIAIVDSNHDGQMSEAEKSSYLADLTKTLQANLHLLIDNKQVPWQVVDQQLEFPTGQANLPTLRLTAHFAADLPVATAAWQAEFLDDNYEGRLGWQEVIVRALPGTNLLASDAPATDVTHELRNYPQDLLQTPKQVNAAKFRFAPQGIVDTAAAPPQANGATTVASNAAAIGKPTDRFAELITIPTLGPMAILLALLAAFGWGAAHAFTPGHGKTIVAAYLVGSRGTARHALFLGLTTTITHTAGVFGLGLITLFASHYILPEKLFPWLGVISGLLVVVIGVSLVWGRLRGLLGWGGHAHHHHDHHEHDHAHDHTHDHDHAHAHDHEHDHAHGLGHSHAPPGADGAPVTWRSLLALGISGGLLPCPSALVLMLGAIALERVAFGLLLILVFSIGLASVLTGIGIVLVHAGKWFERIPEGNRLLRVVPVASAAFITLVGLGISWQALVQTGILPS